MDGQVVEAPPDPSRAPVWNITWSPHGSDALESHGYRPTRLPGLPHWVMVWEGRLTQDSGKTRYVRLVQPPSGSGQ